MWSNNDLKTSKTEWQLYPLIQISIILIILILIRGLWWLYMHFGIVLPGMQISKNYALEPLLMLQYIAKFSNAISHIRNTFIPRKKNWRANRSPIFIQKSNVKTIKFREQSNNEIKCRNSDQHARCIITFKNTIVDCVGSTF